MKIRAMTFNIQHTVDFMNGGLNPELMANTIRAFNPDFCVLNEVYGHQDGARVVFEDQAKLIAELAGMPFFAFRPATIVDGSPYGNAIVARRPMESCRTVMIPDPLVRDDPNAAYETRCIIAADFGKYAVLGSHFGLSLPEKELAVKTVLTVLESTEKPVILCGDFNMTPDDGLLAPIFSRLRDTASVMTEKKLSFPSDRPRMKIDYIFASGEFEILCADIPPVIASDHRPHIADLVLPD